MNLVIIVSDTFRWDYLGAYGNTWIRTPNLDTLASESALFLDAYVEGLPTINARRVIMTGRNIFPFEYRPQKGDPLQQYGWHPLYDEDVTLAEHLQEHGYFTAFFNDVYHLMKPGKNFHRGFDQWFWIRGQEADPYALPDRSQVEDALAKVEAAYGRKVLDESWLLKHLVLRKQWKSDADTVVGQTMSRAAEWVRNYRLEKPFYLHVEVFDPHEPWDPPAEYAREYEPDYGDSLDGCAAPGLTSEMSDRQLANARAAYAGEVTLVDRWAGELLGALRDAGRMTDTLVVFTSDHGCMLGEQGQVHKGYDRLRNQCTRVPLLIRHPKREAAGVRVRGFCQHQDIVPTVLSVMDLPAPDRVLGRNIWPQTTGRGDPPDYVISAYCHYVAIRTTDWNYMRAWTKGPTGEPLKEELYDLHADPEELTNVVSAHTAVAERLKGRIEEHIKRFAPLTSGSFQVVAEADRGLSFNALPLIGIK